MNRIVRSLVASLVVTGWALAGLPEDRAAAQKLLKDGNFKEAFEAYATLATQPRTDSPELVGEDLRDGVMCLIRLDDLVRFDGFVEAAVKAQPGNWRLLEAAAQRYREVGHYGFVVGGEFQRGQHRGGGEYATVVERDRVQALQLMAEAERLVRAIPDRRAAAAFYLHYAGCYRRPSYQAWLMQTLTDLATLPEPVPGYGDRGGGRTGAPVDAAGKPVFYAVPSSWEQATNDGERWRWLLAESERLDPAQADNARLAFAQFLHEQFGVQTMARYGWFFRPRDESRAARAPTISTA